MRQLRQTGPQGPIAFAGLAGALCARAFVIPRRDPAPGGQAGGGPKRAISTPHSATNSSPPR